MRVRVATAADAAAIAAIYAPYVTGTVVSFETEAPDADEIARRMAEADGRYPWFVACDPETGAVTGFACAAAFRTRPAYRFSVETTVYVADGALRRGYGRQLYKTLLPVLEMQGYAQAIASITLPNHASVILHERLGFRQAGTYEKVGFKFREWRSVGIWQRPLCPLSTRPEEPKPFSAIWAGSPPPPR